MSLLLDHAIREMKFAGLYDKDSDYNGALAPAVERLVAAHANENHSGGSHGAVLRIFNKVVNFKPLSPLTADPAEWVEVGKMLWWSKRQSSAFSVDGGKTWYDIDEDGRPTHESAPAVKAP